MNKEDFIREISTDTKIPKQVVDRIVDSFIRRLKDGLARGEKIKISGFGTFELIKAVRMFYRNPQTGERIPRVAKVRARFIPSPLLKKRIKD